jgi:hypothetical protein
LWTVGGAEVGGFRSDGNLTIVNDVIVDGTVSGTDLIADDIRVDSAGTLTAPDGWHQASYQLASGLYQYVWSNKPALLLPFGFGAPPVSSGERISKWIDLRQFTEFRMVVYVAAPGVDANSKIGAQFENGGSFYGLDNDTLDTISDNAISDNVTNTSQRSAWNSIAAAARVEDCQVRIVGEGGDGAADPSYRRLEIQFRS